MLKIIAALSENGVIGKSDELPFRLHDDLIRFKKVTGSNPVIMGRRTLGSILKRNQKPLPGRENVVLTHSRSNIEINGVTISDMPTVLERSRIEDMWVIGGGEIYLQALPYASEMYLTRVHAEIEGDTFFPRWNLDEWNLVSVEKHKADDRNEFPFTWEKYMRRDRYVEMANCRTEEQRRIMQEIRETGVCPFCPENLERWHKKPILWSGIHWTVSESMWPYLDTGIHLMLFLKTHAESPASMPAGAFEELSSVLRWAEAKYQLRGGGLFMRFGECLWTGGTIRHIHAHLVSKTSQNGEPVKFYLG